MPEIFLTALLQIGCRLPAKLLDFMELRKNVFFERANKFFEKTVSKLGKASKLDVNVQKTGKVSLDIHF